MNGFGGLDDVGVGVMYDLLPLGARGVPRVVVPPAVDAPCTCRVAPLVFGNTDICVMRPGTDGAGLASPALVPQVPKAVAFVAPGRLLDVVLKGEGAVGAEAQLAGRGALERHHGVPRVAASSVQQAPRRHHVGLAVQVAQGDG